MRGNASYNIVCEMATILSKGDEFKSAWTTETTRACFAMPFQ